MFSEEITQEVDAIVTRYPEAKSALLPLLHLLQREKGWVSPEGMKWAAERLDLSPAHVEGVVTFYSMYFTKPVGRNVIQLCRTLSCDIRGTQSIRKMIHDKIGIGPGETSSDEKYSLIEVECIGACGTAPAMMIGDSLHENLTPERVAAILDKVED